MFVLEAAHKYTYTDYASWDTEDRYELIDGVPYMMAPGPTRLHQTVVGRLFNQLFNYLNGKPCEVFVSPFDVRLNANKYDNTVVQPDIVVVCDKSKLDDKGCKGVPDMVIEVLSQSSMRRDKVLKFKKYQQTGVREYWIVDPDSKTISAHVLENGRYTTSEYGKTGMVPVHVLLGCSINAQEVFAE